MNMPKKESSNAYSQIPIQHSYITCDGLDFLWDKRNIYEIRKEWNNGTSIQDIAEQFNRNINEVFILLLDQAMSGYIEWRENGIFGSVTNAEQSR